MVDFNKKSGNTRNRTEDDNDEGYNNHHDKVYDTCDEIKERDYTKTYRGRGEVKQIEGVLIKDTGNAVLFKFAVHDNEIVQEWFPASHIKSIHHEAGKKSKMVISLWIAGQKGIE